MHVSKTAICYYKESIQLLWHPLATKYLILIFLDVCKWADVSLKKIIKIVYTIVYYVVMNRNSIAYFGPPGICCVLLLRVLLPSVLWHCWLSIRKSTWPVKNWVMRCWHGYLSGARCKWSAYGPADATATPSSPASLKTITFYLSGAGLPSCPGKEVVK